MLILGCGYLGTALAHRELAAGRPVAALTRNAARAAELRALGVSPVVEADIASDDWHKALDPSGQAIVCCVSPSAPGAEGYRHSFIAGAQSVTRWLNVSSSAGRAPSRDLIFTSSTAVYPQTDGKWVDENTPVEVSALSPSGAVLREAEAMFLAMPCNILRRAWILRLGGLYGPGRHQWLDALRSGEKTFSGNGEHWLNLIHLEDAVSAIGACLSASAEISGGIFNAVDDEPAHKREIITWLATQLHLDATQIQFDATKSARTAHRLGLLGEYPNRKISNKTLKNNVDWNPVMHSFREGYMKILTCHEGLTA